MENSARIDLSEKGYPEGYGYKFEQGQNLGCHSGNGKIGSGQRCSYGNYKLPSTAGTGRAGRT